MINSFQHDARLKYNLTGSDFNDLTKNDKKVYVKSTWTPSLGNPDLELRLQNFNEVITLHTNANLNAPKKPSRNLNRLQQKTLQLLKNSDDIIILLADKNLGPVTLDKGTYINRVINDHLSDTSTYQQLSDKTAQQKLDELRDQLQHLFQNPSAATQNTLQDIEQKILQKILQNCPLYTHLLQISKNTQRTLDTTTSSELLWITASHCQYLDRLSLSKNKTHPTSFYQRLSRISRRVE